MKNKFENLVIQAFKTTAAIILISLISFTNVLAQVTKGEAVVATETVTATVVKINHSTRKIDIKTTDGQNYMFYVSTDVKNLEQVKKGDVITAIYTEALAYDVRKKGTAGAATADAAAIAKPGEKPAGAIAQQTTVTVKITAIDTKKPSVTVKLPEGDLETIKVKDPSKLKDLKVGDVVDLTYTEAFAIKVDPVTKK